SQQQLQQALFGDSWFHQLALHGGLRLAIGARFVWPTLPDRMPQLASQSWIADSERVHGDVEVFALLNAAAHRANIRKHLVNRSFLVGGVGELAIAYRLIDYELNVGLRFTAQALVITNAKLPDELIGVGIIRQHQNFYFQIFRQQYLNRLLRGLHP